MHFTFTGFKKELKLLPFISLSVYRGAYRKAGDVLQEHEVTEQEGTASN